MLISIFLAIFIVILSIFLYCTFIPSYRTYRMVNLIHGPKGLPFIGQGWTIGRLNYNEILDYFYGVSKEYSRLALIWLLGVPLVLMQDPDDVSELLSNSVQLEKGVEYKPLIPWLNEGLLLSTGEKWHSRRKLLTPTFHFKILEENLISMQKHALTLVNKLLEFKNDSINIHEVINRCTLDVISETAMGINFGAQDNQSKEYVESIKKTGEIALFRMQNLYLHREWLFSLTTKGMEFKKYLNRLHSFTNKIIKERKETMNTMESDQDNIQGKKKKAFLDLLLEFDKQDRLNEADIREEVDTFLFEGHDTTSSAITFTIFMLALHQDVQAKVVEELDSILEEDQQLITKQNLNDMKYLEKVIKEVLRLYPSVPYISRKLTKDLKLKGNVIMPAGSNAVIMPYIIHRLPEYYPDPEKFDPERFSIENVSNRHPFAYIPFSAGPKNCIGQKFAMMELKVIISTLLRHLHLNTLTKLEEIKLLPMMILRTESPILIKVSPRHK